MSHTKEPWVTVGESSDKGWLTQIINSKCVIASDTKLSEEDARRIVACVNACADIPTTFLEKTRAGTIAKNIAGTIMQMAELEHLTARRDELQARKMSKVACDAIASVKGSL